MTLACGINLNDKLTIAVNTDHDHRSSNNGCCVISTFPHASLETVPRLHVRCYGPERPLPSSPWHQDIWRGANGATNGAVVACYSRCSLYFGSWNLCREYAPLYRSHLYDVFGGNVGLTLLQARIPEKLSPGSFDIWGSSHQIFHVLVVMAAGAHLIGLLKAFDYAHSSRSLVG